MRRIAFVLTIAGLAGCGADGAPIRPTAEIGIGVGTNGLTTGARVGASNGTVSIGVST